MAETLFTHKNITQSIEQYQYLFHRIILRLYKVIEKDFEEVKSQNTTIDLFSWLINDEESWIVFEELLMIFEYISIEKEIYKRLDTEKDIKPNEYESISLLQEELINYLDRVGILLKEKLFNEFNFIYRTKSSILTFKSKIISQSRLIKEFKKWHKNHLKKLIEICNSHFNKFEIKELNSRIFFTSKYVLDKITINNKNTIIEENMKYTPEKSTPILTRVDIALSMIDEIHAVDMVNNILQGIHSEEYGNIRSYLSELEGQLSADRSTLERYNHRELEPDNTLKNAKINLESGLTKFQHLYVSEIYQRLKDFDLSDNTEITNNEKSNSNFLSIANKIIQNGTSVASLILNILKIKNEL